MSKRQKILSQHQKDESDSHQVLSKAPKKTSKMQEVDVDGWKLEKSQLDLVEETEEDLEDAWLRKAVGQCSY